MGSFVIETVGFLPRGGRDKSVLRASGTLTVLEGHHPELVPLLAHVFARAAAPDLIGALVDFVVSGRAYQWRADFALGTCELIDRSTNQLFSDTAAIAAEMDRVLGTEPRVRLASFATPAAEVTPASPVPERPADPPSSESLASELAHYEDQLRAASQTHDAAAALYGELFPLLESMESAARRLHKRVDQLQRHEEAEAAHAQFRQLQAEIQERREAVRAARQLEKQVNELAEHEPQMTPVPQEAIDRAALLEQDVAGAREAYAAAEKQKKSAEYRADRPRPLGWWIAGLLSIPIFAAPYLLASYVPLVVFYMYHAWAAAALFTLAWPVAGLQTMRRSVRRRRVKLSAEQLSAARREVELAELALNQHLRPFGVRSAKNLQGLAEERRAWNEDYTQMQARLAEMRKVTGTDDALAASTNEQSPEAAELEERCRNLAPYLLSPSDRESVERTVHELESEARYQKQAATELQGQCERLADGWSNLPEMIERVASLRQRLAEWQRWEKAFRRIRDVIDKLPDVPDLAAAGPEAGAAAYLERITCGRWTRLHYDPIEAEFKLYDQSTGLWIRADRENGAVRSTVDLAYRLSLLEAHADGSRLPLWLTEPFAELPESMATAAAAILSEVSQQRQVVVVCRQRPQVSWPEGASLQG